VKPESAVYVGWLSHARRGPRSHGFAYRVYLLYLDLDELPGLLAGPGPLRAGRFGLLSFERSDYLGGAGDLAEAAKDRVQTALGFRYSEEKQKPNGSRLREYTDAGLPAMEQEMYSPAPITPSMEIAAIAEYFRFLNQQLGPNDPTVQALLNGRTPERAAAAYVNTSKLQDVAERKRLANDPEAVKSSEDGMIALARILDGPARRYRKEFEDRIEAVLMQSAGKVAQARFAVYGANEYPDATFTLRLSFARVAGYRNQAAPVPYTTNFAGLYRRATGKEPYKLPARWVKMKSAIKLDTPFDFVSTADTHGGNSGSPTVNGKGEIVGILFDGNIEGLPNRFVYTEKQARSVHVSSQGIVEALRNVYRASRILTEIGM
jgi:hypothetical protein